ncbi:MAG TPA: hypothetical protein VEM15_07470 [Thermodesulfobacteriota bacterium]|nr:hypothetical protein [Thermodesulfobacteriota bacterium]
MKSNSNFETRNPKLYELRKATPVTAREVIPAKAGIQETTGFRIKFGMTDKVKELLTQYTI